MTRSSVNGKIDEGNYGICGGCSTLYFATFVCLFRSSINIIIGEVNGGIDGGRSTLLGVYLLEHSDLLPMEKMMEDYQQFLVLYLLERWYLFKM